MGYLESYRARLERNEKELINLIHAVRKAYPKIRAFVNKNGLINKSRIYKTPRKYDAITGITKQVHNSRQQSNVAKGNVTELCRFAQSPVKCRGDI